MCEWWTCDSAAWQWCLWPPLCNREWNSPEGRPVTDSHFILPVRARKPLPCHNPSPCNLSASWVSAVAIETTVKGKISSSTPEVIHKTHSWACLTAYVEKYREADRDWDVCVCFPKGQWVRPQCPTNTHWPTSSLSSRMCCEQISSFNVSLLQKHQISLPHEMKRQTRGKKELKDVFNIHIETFKFGPVCNVGVVFACACMFVCIMG